MNQDEENSEVLEDWEEELLAGHRWGRISSWYGIKDNTGLEEHIRLKKLWRLTQPLSKSAKQIIKQISLLEICNWNLEESILTLCSAIGENEPTKLSIGHWRSLTEERLKKIWAYYLSLLSWLKIDETNWFDFLLISCDPEKKIKSHIFQLLGERNELKELCVERFCLCLGLMLCSPRKSAQAKAHHAATSVIEEEIRKLDPDNQVLKFPKFDVDACSYYGFEPCRYNLFRHYDIVISSIGAGKWRAVMPRDRNGGLERVQLLERYLSSIEEWVNGENKKEDNNENKLYNKIHEFLGIQDNVKLFLASYLVSLLRSQQIASKPKNI